jgi:histidine ammonia-lyase
MVVLNGENLSIEAFIKITREYDQVSLDEEAIKKVIKSRTVIDNIVANKQVVYGVNTGFGKLCDHTISYDDLYTLQVNLLRSHACGIGNTLPEDVVRGMMVLRVNALVKGYSGIRLETIEKLIEFLNKRVFPVVYEQGSLGASGDLVPLAHLSLPLIGEGEVFYNNQVTAAKVALNQLNISPLDGLYAKEGLALINGTQAMTSIGAHAVYDAKRLYVAANLAGAMTMEAQKAIIDAFDERVHQIRNHSGQVKTAAMVKAILKGSKNIKKSCVNRVQDAYSIRCIPQVHGATLDALEYIENTVINEMNAVTDNPIIFSETQEAISAGNFHGQNLALALDFLAIAVSELANISERRLERSVNPHLNQGLPGFLAKEKGLNSGFMIVQYAAASLVSENKVLSHPASVDSIPSSGNQEDHVSMGTISARKAMQIIENARRVIAMELLTATQAVDFDGKDGLSAILMKVYNLIREHVPFITQDTIMHPHIESVNNLIKSGRLFEEVNHGEWLK